MKKRRLLAERPMFPPYNGLVDILMQWGLPRFKAELCAFEVVKFITPSFEETIHEDAD